MGGCELRKQKNHINDGGSQTFFSVNTRGRLIYKSRKFTQLSLLAFVVVVHVYSLVTWYYGIVSYKTGSKLSAVMYSKENYS